MKSRPHPRPYRRKLLSGRYSLRKMRAGRVNGRDAEKWNRSTRGPGLAPAPAARTLPIREGTTVTDEPNPTPGEQPGNRRQTVDILIPVGILAVWIILQIWVLPKAGVST